MAAIVLCCVHRVPEEESVRQIFGRLAEARAQGPEQNDDDDSTSFHAGDYVSFVHSHASRPRERCRSHGYLRLGLWDGAPDCGRGCYHLAHMQDLIAKTIMAALPDASVRVESPDGTHWGAIVISPSFVGLMRVKQHQMVLNALKEEFDSERLHALQLQTFTPEAWEAAQSARSPLSTV